MEEIEMNHAETPAEKRPAFFLDRDGVINVDHGYVVKIEDFEFADGIFDLLKNLQEMGFVLVVVTNQSGIGRGYYSETDFANLTEWMVKRFAEKGITIAGVYHCPHGPDDGCSCRKPAPGMLLTAMDELGLDAAKSWMLGDKESDMAVAKAAGVKNRVFLGTKSSISSTYSVSRLHEVLECLTEESDV